MFSSTETSDHAGVFSLLRKETKYDELVFVPVGEVRNCGMKSFTFLEISSSFALKH